MNNVANVNNTFRELDGEDEFVLVDNDFEPVREFEKGRDRVGDDETPDPIGTTITDYRNKPSNKPAEITLAEIRREKIRSYVYGVPVNEMPSKEALAKIGPQRLDSLREEAHQVHVQFNKVITASQIQSNSLPAKLGNALAKIYNVMINLDTEREGERAGSENTFSWFQGMARKAQRAAIYGHRSANPETIERKKRWLQSINNEELKTDQYESTMDKIHRGTGNRRWGFLVARACQIAWNSIADENAPPVIEDWYCLMVKMELDNLTSNAPANQNDAITAAMDWMKDISLDVDL